MGRFPADGSGRAQTISVSLVGAGSLGVRVGDWLKGWLDELAGKGGAATVRTLAGASWQTRLATLEADYAAGVASQQSIDGLYADVNSWRSSSLQQLYGTAQKYLQKTVIDMVDADSPLLTKDLKTALTALRNQMLLGGTTFNATVPTLGAQTAVGSPAGNHVVVGSVKNGPGALLACPFPETVTFACTADSYTGGQTAGRETFAAAGQAKAASVYAYNWPLGSGVTKPYTAVDGTLNNQAGSNLLYNSDFQVYSNPNLADQWAALVGTVGTNILNGTSSNAYTSGGGSLQVVGDGGGTLTAVTQKFGTAASTSAGAGGTPAVLTPLTAYHFCGFGKVSAVPGAGVLTVDLVDGSNAVVADAAGTNNTFNVSLTGWTTSFASFSGDFRTPARLPATVKLRLRLSTAVDSGKSLYLGRLSFAQAAPMYAGGPNFTVHSGNTAALAGDAWTLALSVVFGVFAREFERFFSMNSSSVGFQMPVTTSSPTVADSLAVA